ncbi:MAG: hypothetical protein ACI4XJ_04460 [Eubacteriales bacterium]
MFNHNEALLYEYVREHEPELFARIQKMVKAGRWHIMGGWYLQPDCNILASTCPIFMYPMSPAIMTRQMQPTMPEAIFVSNMKCRMTVITRLLKEEILQNQSIM